MQCKLAFIYCLCTCSCTCRYHVFSLTVIISLNGNLITHTPLCYSMINCLRILSLSLSLSLSLLTFSPLFLHTYTHLPPSGNRVALVQAALARQLENDDEGLPMSSRRPTSSQPEPIISPSLSFTDENGLTNSSSQGSTSSGHLQVSYSCDGHLTFETGL